MPSTMRLPLISIEFNREEIPVETMAPSMAPDEKWRFVDTKGHGHFWDGEDLPTLEWVVTGTEWVGDEYDGEEYEVGEHRCRLCGQVVEPKRKAEHGPSFIRGLVTYTVTIDREIFALSGEQYADAVAKWAEVLRDATTRR